MRVGVVGGGIAGLAAALRLHQAGEDVTVLDAAPRVGGVLRSEPDGGWIHEHAANAFLSGTPDGAVALCRELGVTLEEAAPAAKKRWIYLNGKLQQLPMGPGDLVKTELLSWRGKLRLLREPFVRARRPSQHGDESVYDFAARRFGDEVARALVSPFVTGIFAGDARHVSLDAGFPSLAALEEQGGVVRGMLFGKKEKREKRKSMAPTGGVEALPRAIEAALGARVKRGAPVTRVRSANGGVEIDGARFDAAVLATPAHAVGALVPELAAHASAIAYAPAVIAYLGYRRADVRHPLDGFGLLVAAGEAPRVLGVLFETSIWSGRAPDGHVLIRCVMGGTRDPGVLALDDAAVLAAARADLATILGIDAAPVHTRVVRWPKGIAQYEVGHAERVAAADQAARTLRLVLAGSGWHGVAVTDCVSDAKRVVSEVKRL